jgi:hypothetical protein
MAQPYSYGSCSTGDICFIDAEASQTFGEAKMITRIAMAAAAVVLLAPATAGAQQGPGGWGSGGRTPQGSYQNSCRDASMRGDRLYATCRDIGRNQRASSLDVSRCARGSDIGNDNGLLVCNGQRGQWESNNGGGGGNGGGWGGNNGGNGGGWGGGNNRPPGGGWGGGNNGRGSITVYKDSNFRGERATFQGEVYNLASTGMNDAISSMEMRGAWEVCTDSNFRGSCQVFDGDVRNLGSTGFNDRISSMRPARGW